MDYSMLLYVHLCNVDKIKYKIVTQSQLFRPYVHEMSPTIYTWVITTMASCVVQSCF